MSLAVGGPTPNPAPGYLDYNATAPIRPGVAEAMASAMAAPGNPSSVHGWGRAARRTLEQAREVVAAWVGATPDRVVFTSGGTEANNQALASIAGPRLVSAIEHDSVLAAAADARRVPVDDQGRLDLGELERLLAQVGPALISVMLANNETGVIQDVAEVARLAHRGGALAHTDAIQVGGKSAIDMARLGVDLLALSAHKLGGPPGIGALVLGPGIEPRALVKGGAQEQQHRAGTENLPAIVGFARAVERSLEDTHFGLRVGTLRDRLEREIRALAPEARIFGQAAPRLPNTSCLTMPGVPNQTQLIELDLTGIAVSTGSACSSGKVGPSHVLAAMGVPPEEAGTAIRISLGWASSDDDVSGLVDVWGTLYRRTRTRRRSEATAPVA